LLVRGVSVLDDAGERMAHFRHRPSRGAEVQQHRRSVRPDDDVVGGNVAMKEILRVHHLERVEQRPDDPVELLLRRSAAEAREPLLHALARLEDHHHVGGGVCLEDAGDLHHAAVTEMRERAGFLEEAVSAPLEYFLMPFRLRPDAQALVAQAERLRTIFLDGDPGPELHIVGPVGDAEAPGADHALDAVALVEHRPRRQHYPAIHDLQSPDTAAAGTTTYRVPAVKHRAASAAEPGSGIFAGSEGAARCGGAGVAWPGQLSGSTRQTRMGQE